MEVSLLSNLMLDKRLNLFTGHFGSGKTEVAVNFAINTARQGKKVIIIDLDIVNTYFRTKDVQSVLEAEGVKVIASEFASTNLDMPTVPAEVYAALQDKDSVVLIDVGGDDEGALVLGQYNRYFKDEPYDMFLIINALRPLTGTPQEILEYISQIEAASRLKASYLINNTNLSYETNADVLLKGQKVVEKTSRISKIPIKCITAKKEIIKTMPENIKEKAFGLNLYLQLPY